MSRKEEDIELFKKLLRFKTISAEGTNGSYRACVDWLAQTCKEIGMTSVQVIEPVENKPILIASLQGSDPSLPCVVLNGHYDVVPCMLEYWNVEPFEALEKDGKIYGRGSQDMKCVVAQYIICLRNIIKAKVQLKRNIHLTLVPDEEIGGMDGMAAFINQGHFKRLLLPSVGIALDEGLANPNENKYTVFYGERAPLWLYVKAKGPTGHGSRFIPDTAISKLLKVTDKALAFRKTEEAKLNGDGCKHCEAKKLGDVTTLNLTVLNAGVTADGGKTYSLNVIPTEAVAGFDIRVAPQVPISEIEAMLDDWTSEEGLEWYWNPQSGPVKNHFVTSIDKTQNPWWGVFSDACEGIGLEIEPEIFPAGTDSRFIREIGVPAFGFSPLSGIPILLHEHNEYITVECFTKGVEIYTELVTRLANADKF